MDREKVCPVCKQVNPPGAAECLRCTEPLIVSSTVLLSDQVKRMVARESMTYHGKMIAGTIALHFVGQTKPLEISVEDTLILGRDAGGSSPNLVDLSPHRAGLLGVSRQHAAIHSHAGGYVIEDLGSTNGTFVNEAPLAPETPIVLANGDSIRLGELMMYIYFKPA